MKTNLLIIAMILCVGSTLAQPAIGLGLSMRVIKRDMQLSPKWKLIKEQKKELIYSDGEHRFTYRFVKDEPYGLNLTCIQCIAEFKDSKHLTAYLEDKVANCKLSPDPDMINLSVVTDLYDINIRAVVVGNKSIVFSY